jgi:hypothetical protein
MALTKMSQHTIEKLLRGERVKRKTHEHVLKAIQANSIHFRSIGPPPAATPAQDPAGAEASHHAGSGGGDKFLRRVHTPAVG